MVNGKRRRIFELDQQQRSGLGMEAQRTAVERFAASDGLTTVVEYKEAETGKAPMPWTGGRNWPVHWRWRDFIAEASDPSRDSFLNNLRN